MPTSGLAPPIDSATALKEYRYVFEDMWQSRTHPAPELFSPVYDGREDPSEDPLPYVHVHAEHLRLLLQMMQSVVNAWLRQTRVPLDVDVDAGESDTDTVVLNSLCPRILHMPSAKVPGLPCTGDYVYEACRIVAVLMVQSAERNQLWRVLAQEGSGSETVTLLRALRYALEKTDLGSLWGKNIGLLYWVGLVFHCAAFGSTEYPFAHALHVRVCFELTYSYHDWHGALKPVSILPSFPFPSALGGGGRGTTCCMLRAERAATDR